MNEKASGVLIGSDGKRRAGWRSSLYEEPLWVSVAWVVGPILLAASGIYFAIR
jgi:hypothetical protein